MASAKLSRVRRCHGREHPKCESRKQVERCADHQGPTV